MMLCEKKKQKTHKPTRQKITIYLTKRHSQRRSYELRDRIQQQNRQHKILADTLHDCLPQEGCDYFGIPDPAAMEADTLYVGFWTDKGNADESTSDFLKQLHGKNIFLFGTAGFGGSKEYFDKILKRWSIRWTRATLFSAAICVRAKCRCPYASDMRA